MRNNLVILLILLLRTASAQMTSVPSDLPIYPFIQYQSNRFELVHENPDYRILYSKFDSLLREGANQIRIVHIGGSHLQADIYTHRMRQDLQSFNPGMLGSRGFFFPYKIAQTNSPSNLWINYTGEWQTCKNTQPEPLLPLGISGITSVLVSPAGSLKIVASFDTIRHYDFNRVRLFCNVSADSCIPEVFPRHLVRKITVNEAGRFIQYDLAVYTDTLSLIINRSDTLNPFELYGISLDNDDPGVTYNTIGVNGAMLKSYLQCSLFSEQLKVLNPDWIILSIGTNEGNTRTFNEESYHSEYTHMISRIKAAVPDAALLLTVPNDSYLHKRYINHNTSVIRKVIYELARANNCAVWDFYSIMGGLNSAKSWYDSGLMAKDHIHFNKAGYLLKGDLFFNAFLNSWNDPSFNEQREEQRAKSKDQDLEDQAD